MKGKFPKSQEAKTRSRKMAVAESKNDPAQGHGFIHPAWSLLH